MNNLPDQVVIMANKDIGYFLLLLKENGVEAKLNQVRYVINDRTDLTFDITVFATVSYNDSETTASWDYFVYEDGSVKLWQDERIQNIVQTIVSSDKS